jgi:DNA-binding MarR family transcriptional regulator
MSKRSAAEQESLPPSEARDDKTGTTSAENKLVSRRILILANVLRRAAGLRYRRLLQLPAGEWGVIAELGHQAPRTLNDLASGIGLDKTQLSRTVSSLIARGLVVRRTNPRDNREVLISLTRAGQNSYAKIMEAGLAANDMLLADLSPIKQKQLVDQIHHLTIRARALLRIEHDLSAMSGDKSE